MLRHLSALVLVLLIPGLVSAQDDFRRDEEAMVRNALSAAPASIADDATVMDLEHNVLREGTNGWVCMPHNPELPGNAPMCLDEPWMELIDAWMNRREPDVRQIGFGYMLQGDFPTSNVDPFAEEPREDNEWLGDAGPHVMMVVPDPALLESLPTDPGNGGPWVMWRDTPYAHVMIPTPRQP
ncbi:MAG: hypothetical protein WDZ89_02415 [Gemmatimonadota bacterium]